MSLRSRIEQEIKDALKSGNRERAGTLRLVKSGFQTREVELRAKHGRDYELDDEEALGVLTRAAKQRRESIESFRKGGRDDLADREEAELAVLGEFLPEALGEDRVREIVREAIAESGASTPKQMGAVMKIVMPKVKGRADGKLVNRLVQELLKG